MTSKIQNPKQHKRHQMLKVAKLIKIITKKSGFITLNLIFAYGLKVKHTIDYGFREYTIQALPAHPTAFQ